MAIIQIDVISDFVCAWCFIGKRNLEKAINIYQKTYPGGKDDAFSITWRPYYLNYNSSPHSVDKRELAETKLSGMSLERREAITKRMDQIGRSVGINFRWGGKIGRTQDAHRLVHLSRAKSPEVQNALVNKIFEAYHEHERDISSHEILREIATSVGFDESDLDKYLESDLDVENVDDEARIYREMAKGSGVPTFIIQGTNLINGAGDLGESMEVFAKVREGELSA
ncbi:thioredoxin-like protein [Xylariaceae sp. FL0662B]|nr:thioredoxin-like protein [Xylariaceae sp. FL0662B]